MKFLILANLDVGLYKFRKELIERLISDGNEVYISLPKGELIGELEALGCAFEETEIDRRGINPVTDMKLMLSYRRLMKKIKPDFVITYTIKPNIYGGIVARFMKIPYAVNITGLGTAFQNDGLVKRLVTLMYKVSTKKARVVFFENEGNRRVMLDMKILPEDKTHTLSGAGVNLDEYSRREYPRGEQTRFLFIGRIMKEKGVDELFYAAERIREKNPDVIFDVVGPMEDDYADVVDSLTKKGVIEYHGYQKDVRPFIESCSCFLLPSYHEGMANTLLEAGAMGRPLITSDIHGCKEAVLEGESGFLCESKNGEALLEAINKFLLLKLEEREKMGYRSAEHIAETFDKKKVVDETVKFLGV